MTKLDNGVKFLENKEYPPNKRDVVIDDCLFERQAEGEEWPHGAPYILISRRDKYDTLKEFLEKHSTAAALEALYPDTFKLQYGFVSLCKDMDEATSKNLLEKEKKEERTETNQTAKWREIASKKAAQKKSPGGT